MSLVSCIHFLCYNNLWTNSDVAIYNRIFCDAIITFTYCFVNIFVMMSGYLLYNKEFKVSRLLKIWSIVWVGCITTAVITCLIDPNVFNIKGAVRSLFPILTASYWYILSYFLLLFVAPLINKSFVLCSQKIMKLILISIGFLVLIFMNLNPFIKTASFVGPDSALPWFCYLYGIGCYIRSYKIRFSFKIYVIGIISFAVLFLTKYFSISVPDGILILGTSTLFSVLLSVSIFLFFIDIFSNIKLSSTIQKCITGMGKSSLLVYILQENYFFREYYWKILNPYQYKDSPQLILAWLFTIVLFWIIASILYKWYEFLNKLFLSKIENKIQSSIKNFYRL